MPRADSSHAFQSHVVIVDRGQSQNNANRCLSLTNKGNYVIAFFVVSIFVIFLVSALFSIQSKADHTRNGGSTANINLTLDDVYSGPSIASSTAPSPIYFPSTIPIDAPSIQSTVQPTVRYTTHRVKPSTMPIYSTSNNIFHLTTS
jgi:hypothetical protein